MLDRIVIPLKLILSLCYNLLNSCFPAGTIPLFIQLALLIGVIGAVWTLLEGTESILQKRMRFLQTDFPLRYIEKVLKISDFCDILSLDKKRAFRRNIHVLTSCRLESEAF